MFLGCLTQKQQRGRYALSYKNVFPSPSGSCSSDIGRQVEIFEDPDDSPQIDPRNYCAS